MNALSTVRADIVAEARTWIGTRFMHQQRMKGVGVDCAGLVIGTARAVGLVDIAFDVTGYPGTPDGKSLLAHCDQHMTRLTPHQLAPGDVIVVRWAKEPQHLGIIGDYLHGGLSMIHAFGTPDGKGTVIEHRLDPNMLRRLIAGYRLPGVPA